MPTAYILVNCTLGSEEKIIDEISNLNDVKEVRGAYGVHDVFVKVKSDNTEIMNHTITIIRKIPGITFTVTLVVIENKVERNKVIFTLFLTSLFLLGLFFLCRILSILYLLQ